MPRRANVSFVEIESDKGHDAFLLDEPELFDTVRGFLEPRRRRTAWHEQLAVAILRPDLAAIADMIPDGARVLDVGCGDGALLDIWCATKGVDGRGIELSQQNVNACVARGLSVVQGDADTDLAEYPVGGVRLRDPEPDHPGDAQARSCAGASAAHRPARGRLAFPISAIGGCGCRCCSAGGCRGPGRWPMPGTTRPTSICARSPISWI